MTTKEGLKFRNSKRNSEIIKLVIFMGCSKKS